MEKKRERREASEIERERERERSKGRKKLGVKLSKWEGNENGSEKRNEIPD